MSAQFPDGQVKTLLHIKPWSFHWQQDYRFVTPVTLAAVLPGIMCTSTTRSMPGPRR